MRRLRGVTEYIVDSSVLLAHVYDEPGAAAARAFLTGDTAISAVNLLEVVTKRLERSEQPETIHGTIAALGLEVIDLNAEIAFLAGEIHAAHRRDGLSLADAACIATARALGATAVTADRAWSALPGDIEVIR